MDDYDFSSDDWSFLDNTDSSWMGDADYSGVNNSGGMVSGGDIGLSDTPGDAAYIDGGTGGFDFSSLTGILGSLGNLAGNPNIQKLINGGLGAVGAYQGYQNNKDIRGMYQNYMNQMTDGGVGARRQLLTDSYINPQAWLDGPEGQALARTVLNATERRDSSIGRLNNPINRQAELQDRLMAGLGNYRAGLSNSITGATSGMQNLGNIIGQYGNYDPYKPVGMGLEEILRMYGNG